MLEVDPEALRELRFREALKKVTRDAHKLGIEAFKISNKDPYRVPREKFLSFAISVFCSNQMSLVGAMDKFANADGRVLSADDVQEFKDSFLDIAASALVVLAAIGSSVAAFRESLQVKH